MLTLRLFWFKKLNERVGERGERWETERRKTERLKETEGWQTKTEGVKEVTLGKLSYGGGGRGEYLPHQPFVLKEKYHNPQYMNYSNELKLALKSTYEPEEASFDKAKPILFSNTLLFCWTFKDLTK